jgi:hypothetical protein
MCLGIPPFCLLRSTVSDATLDLLKFNEQRLETACFAIAWKAISKQAGGIWLFFFSYYITYDSVVYFMISSVPDSNFATS